MSTSTGKAAIGCPSKPRHWRVIGLNGMVGYTSAGYLESHSAAKKTALARSTIGR